MQILLVEDDPNLVKILLTIFKNSSYKSVYATNIAEGLKAALSQSFDIMIFDWMLQDETGVELLREIREYDITTPVLMLTARERSVEQINGDFEYTVASSVIDAHIRNIRKKISNPNLIESVYGVGYKILGV